MTGGGYLVGLKYVSGDEIFERIEHSAKHQQSVRGVYDRTKSGMVGIEYLEE